MRSQNYQNVNIDIKCHAVIEQSGDTVGPAVCAKLRFETPVTVSRSRFTAVTECLGLDTKYGRSSGRAIIATRGRDGGDHVTRWRRRRRVSEPTNNSLATLGRRDDIRTAVSAATTFPKSAGRININV